MRSRKSRTISIMLLLGIAALAAQLAGVGASRPGATVVKPTKLAVLTGASVPDTGSTQLASTSVKAAAGETVRMSGVAKLRVAKLAKAGNAVAVCGLRYSRAKDASWSLGTPYETVVLAKQGTSNTVKIERSFAAPAADTYRMSVACHLSSASKGTAVTANGTLSTSRGLPEGAATPIA